MIKTSQVRYLLLPFLIKIYNYLLKNKKKEETNYIHIMNDLNVYRFVVAQIKIWDSSTHGYSNIAQQTCPLYFFFVG